MNRPTRGWVLTRSLMAIAVMAAALAVLWLLAFGIGDYSIGFVVSVPRALAAAAGLAGMLVGLAWMWRIYRGPRDEARHWRYRDH